MPSSLSENKTIGHVRRFRRKIMCLSTFSVKLKPPFFNNLHQHMHEGS